jgi:cardiolipin synthase
MPTRRRNLSAYGGAALALSLQISCSTISQNARNTTESRQQATAGLTTGGNIAFAAFRATAVAAVRQPVTTAKLGLVNLYHRPRELITGTIPFDLISQPALPDAPGSPRFEAMLDRKKFPDAESGSLSWLVDGGGFFPELDRQIDAARKSIDIQLFIFDNDDIAVRYADKLKRRSREVPVRLLFDDLGSTFAYSSAPETPAPAGFLPPDDMVPYLKAESEIHVRRILDPWLSCDHTKLLVFDSSTAILGGMNIGREYYSEWHDLMVRVNGPVVATLAKDFNRAWRKAGPLGDFALLRKPRFFHRPRPVGGGIPLRVLRTDAAAGRYEILDATLLAIRGARERIWIENPYFGSGEIALAVRDAALRGVDVRVILPSAGDSPIMDAGNLVTANGLIRAGAKIYRYPKMTHLKVMICDGWATMGSANLDTLSMRINRELNLAFSDPGAVLGLERAVFQPDFRKSEPIRLKETVSSTPGLTKILVNQL